MAGQTARRRIVVITQFYPPEAGAASHRASATARALAAAGDDVTVVTGKPSFPDGIVGAEYEERDRSEQRDHGIAVRRVWTYASPRLRAIDRLLNWLSVAAGAIAHIALRRDPVDIVFVSTPPITLGLAALVAAARWRARLVVDVRDVYPDVAIKMGIWKKNSAVARMVGALADALYRRASLILTVTDTCRREILARGVTPEKVVTAPNGFDRFEPALATPILRGDGEFIIAYAGNMGVATGIEVLLDAAHELRAEQKYRFVLVGGGAEGGSVARRVEGEQLDNVELLGPQPRDVAAAIMRDADVCVVPLKRGIVDSLPTKLFDSLSLGTPVIVCADGEARDFIERSGGGIAVPPEDGSALAGAIGALAADGEQRRRFGRRGLAYVTEHYDRAEVSSAISRRIAALSCTCI